MILNYANINFALSLLKPVYIMTNQNTLILI